MLKEGLLRVYNQEGEVEGAAFLVSADRALTCAHVVLDALNLPEDTPAAPEGIVTLDFAHLSGNPKISAQVEGWYDLKDNPAFDEAEDIAVLKLESVPDKAKPMPLKVLEDYRGEVETRGFPESYDGGDTVKGELIGLTGEGWVQLDAVLKEKAIVGGFSGAPVWSEAHKAVVGMIVRSRSAARQEVRDTSAYIIPSQVLQRALPLLFNPYKGLEAFQEEDKGRYFGRERETDEVFARLEREPHLVAVIGNSGSGKSSLVFAGLLPQLRETD